MSKRPVFYAKHPEKKQTRAFSNDPASTRDVNFRYLTKMEQIFAFFVENSKIQQQR